MPSGGYSLLKVRHLAETTVAEVDDPLNYVQTGGSQSQLREDYALLIRESNGRRIVFDLSKEGSPFVNVDVSKTILHLWKGLDDRSRLSVCLTPKLREVWEIFKFNELIPELSEPPRE